MTESLLILNIYVEVVRSSKPAIPGGVKAVVNRNIHRFWESCLQRSRRHKGQTPWLPLQTLRIELASQSPCCFSYFKYKTEGGMEEGGRKQRRQGGGEGRRGDGRRRGGEGGGGRPWFWVVRLMTRASLQLLLWIWGWDDLPLQNDVLLGTVICIHINEAGALSSGAWLFNLVFS